MPSPTPSRRIELVPIAHIAPNPWQPRQQIKDEDLADLVSSIQEFGFTSSLEVRHDPKDPQAKLQLIFGHRRLRAAELAGMTTAPVAIVERSDQEMVKLAYYENSTQLPLSYWDEAGFFRQLQDEFGFSIRTLAEYLNVSKGYVQNRIDLLKLPPDSPIRAAVSEGTIELTTAITLQVLSRTLPQSHIEALLAQLHEGTLSGKDLTQLKLAATKGTESSSPKADAEPEEQREAPPSVEVQEDPGAGISGVSGVGRFADLELADEPFAGSLAPDAGGSRPVPCSADDEWLTETGQLHPDRTESVPEDAVVQATRELLQCLRRQVPRLEHLAAVADVSRLAPAERMEAATLVRRLWLVGETFRPDEQPMAS